MAVIEQNLQARNLEVVLVSSLPACRELCAAWQLPDPAHCSFCTLCIFKVVTELPLEVWCGQAVTLKAKRGRRKCGVGADVP